MQVSKWGNSLAVRLPAGLVREMGLKEGDRVELTPAEGHLTVRRQPTSAEILDGMRRFRGRLPAADRLPRDAAHES